MALFWLRNLPGDALSLLLAGSLKPGPLTICCDGEPTAKEVGQNAHWIRPFVRKFKQCVPFGFFIADCLVLADKYLKVRPTPCGFELSRPPQSSVNGFGIVISVRVARRAVGRSGVEGPDGGESRKFELEQNAQGPGVWVARDGFCERLSTRAA